MMLEVLNVPFVLLSGRSGLKLAEVPPLAFSRVLLPLVKPIFTRS
jgi:hypothetical protein